MFIDFANPNPTPQEQQETIELALSYLKDKISANVFTTPTEVKDYLRLKLKDYEHEVFGVMLLDCQHGLLFEDVIFRGTLSQTSVYPRELCKLALQHNAAAAFIYHNHPSGQAEPSKADIELTNTLKTALDYVDVRLLDHFVVTNTRVVSLAERGLIKIVAR